MKLSHPARWAIASGVAAANLVGWRVQRTWGATPAERVAVYPGDELVPNPMHRTTRATSIDAPPEQVWPWIIQIGQGRGGWYSYAMLSRLGSSIFTQNATEVLEEFQHPAVGDPIDLIDRIIFTIAQIHPNQSLVLYADDRNQPSQPWTKSWSWNLIPEGPSGTRLVLRENFVWASPIIGASIRAIDWLVFTSYLHTFKELRGLIETGEPPD